MPPGRAIRSNLVSVHSESRASATSVHPLAQVIERSFPTEATVTHMPARRKTLKFFTI